MNSEVLSSVSFLCPTQNGKQNNLLQSVSLQSLFSHATDISYFLFPVHKYIRSVTYLLSGKRTKKGKKYRIGPELLGTKEEI